MTTAAGEDAGARLRRLGMRSMRRGIKEMDLILDAFARAELAGMTPGELDLYEALLAENDLEIYSWIAGQTFPPERFAVLIDRIASGAQGVVRPG